MTLLALILAYVVSHMVSKPERFRQFGWFNTWHLWLNTKMEESMPELKAVLIIALPVFLMSFVLLNVFDSTMGILLITILVLSYCIGPKSLEEDVNSGEIKTRLGVRKNAQISFLIKKMTKVSMQRWFGVFFWYVVLGVVGALMYRFSERLSFYANDEGIKQAVAKIMKVLNYPVAWMMVVSLAIASDFERIYKKCKVYMNLDNLYSMDDTFLYEAADFAVENCELESENESSIEEVTLNVLKRMLLVWLVFVALLVILAV